jgi:N-acetylmuramoyl-L-alanine amidase
VDGVDGVDLVDGVDTRPCPRFVAPLRGRQRRPFAVSPNPLLAPSFQLPAPLSSPVRGCLFFLLIWWFAAEIEARPAVVVIDPGHGGYDRGGMPGQILPESLTHSMSADGWRGY